MEQHVRVETKGKKEDPYFWSQINGTMSGQRVTFLGFSDGNANVTSTITCGLGPAASDDDTAPDKTLTLSAFVAVGFVCT